MPVPDVPLAQVAASAWRVSTDASESDGTFARDATTLVLVQVEGGGHTGIGYSYTDASAATLVNGTFAALLRGRDAFAIAERWRPADFRRLLERGAVDVLQADATRCGGLTGFLRAAALADAFGIAVSSHCAPALHVAAFRAADAREYAL